MSVDRKTYSSLSKAVITVDVYFSVYVYRVIDPVCNTEIASYRIHHILFCARGPSDSEERRCFAFTCSHGDSVETAIFQCHVFRCEAPDAVRHLVHYVWDIISKSSMKCKYLVPGSPI